MTLSTRVALLLSSAVVCAFGGISAAPATNAPANAYVLGDSIGEGLADASGLKKLAHISVHIRGPKAIQQINATPVGAVAFIVLGTNDADGDGRIAGIDKSIDDVVHAGERRKLKMIWIGPPCVRRSFDSRSRQLDKILSAHFAGTAVTYISMRDERICSGVFHEPDGVHLTMKGYRYMWAKTEQAVEWPSLAAIETGKPGAGNDAAAAIAGTPKFAGAALAQDEAAGTGPMVEEIHRPPRDVSSPIVWMEVSR